MANTLASFLVGVGLDFDNKGAKQAVSSLDSIRSTALQAGAAVAGAFGARALTKGISDRTNLYRQQAEVIGTTTESLDALARVYEREGGNADGLISQLESIKRLRAGLQAGKVDWIPEGALAGLDTSAIINEADPAKAYQNILDQLSKMSVEQRLNVSQAIGLDNKSINLAVKGGEYLTTQLAKALDRRPMINQLEKDSEIFSKNWSDMWDNIGGITDRASAKILPKVNGITGSVNDFFDSNRGDINSGFDAVFGTLADNLDLALAGIIGLKAASLGSVVEKFTKLGGTANGIGNLAKKLGLVGVAYAGIDFTLREGGEDGAISAGNTIGRLGVPESITDFLDDPHAIDNILKELMFPGSTKQYSDDEMEAMSRDMMTRVPSFEPTVITPAQVAPLSQPAQQAEAVAAQAQAQQSSIGYNYMQQRPVVNNIYLEGRMIKQVVNQAIDESAEQAVRDVRSPIDR